MRKFISGLLAIAAAAFTGCYESGTDADNTSREARISICLLYTSDAADD